MNAYENFIEWKKDDSSLTEDIFLKYFRELKDKYKPNTLWCLYSMLKSIVRMKHGIDLKTYSNLTTYLRRHAKGYKRTETKMLSANDVQTFLKEAPDSKYLATKVALIFAIIGGCRSHELKDITAQDIENHGETILVRITNPKTKMPRLFTIYGPLYEIVKKYQTLRTSKSKNPRFFQNFQKGKCTAQPIGLNKFSAMPKEIANFLRLPDANSYTGHSFRRTSDTMMVDSRADKVIFKSQRGRRTESLAESYVKERDDNKTTTTDEANNLEPNSKEFCPKPEPHPSTSFDYENNFVVPFTIKEDLGHSSTSLGSTSPSSPLIVDEDNEIVWVCPD